MRLLGGHPGLRVIGVAVIAVLLSTACGRRSVRRSPPPPDVSIVTVSPRPVPETFEFPAEVTPYRRVEVRARVDGIIEAREFVEGSIVKPGQLLYRLDRVRYQAAYSSARARLENAQRTLQRLEPLVAQHAVAQQDVDNARTEVDAAQAAVDQTKKDLDDTDVRAEIEGRVGRTLLEVGARVTGPADLLTTIDRLDPVYVSFRPSSEQLLEWQQNPRSRALINPGSPLTVHVVLPDGSVLPRTGRLDFVAPSLDATTGTREFRAVFRNPDHLLLPGQFVRARLDGFTRDSAFAVPQRAVQMGLGRQFVYVVGAGDTATIRDVQPGPWSGALWIINGGLQAGDRVVVDGTQKVRPGAPVHPTALGDSVSAPAGPGR